MRKLSNQKGFTVVEVIVAAVILVVVAVALLSLYGTNFGWIVNAGYKTEAIDAAKTDIDTQIASGTAAATDSITFSFNGTIPAKVDLNHTVKVYGIIAVGEGSNASGSEQVELKTFIPKVP